MKKYKLTLWQYENSLREKQIFLLQLFIIVVQFLLSCFGDIETKSLSSLQTVSTSEQRIISIVLYCLWNHYWTQKSTVS